MARLIYCLVLYLAAPLIVARLLWRSRRQPAYRQHLGERWGFYRQKIAAPLIWVHAVSVGETRAAAPLIAGLQARYPNHRILLTGMTATGRETGASVYGDRVIQAYLPYDYPGAVGRFLATFQPQFGVLMETEVWPNLLRACKHRGTPVFLVNARLSERSARGYRRFSALTGSAFQQLNGVAAQTEEDAQRLQALGVASIAVCGNLKFDVSLPAELVAIGEQWRQVIGERPVFLAASTRDGEEAAILQAWRRQPGGALLVIVPRHPQRFQDVATLCTGMGFSCRRRSAGLPDADTDIWLGDSMGEMAAYYALADLAYIGGSLLPLGGQNLIEAAAAACPILLGPHTFNFRQASEQAIACGAARRVADAEALVMVVQQLLASPAQRAEMKTAGLAFAEAHRGASEKTLEFIVRQLGQAGR